MMFRLVNKYLQNKIETLLIIRPPELLCPGYDTILPDDETPDHEIGEFGVSFHHYYSHDHCEHKW